MGFVLHDFYAIGHITNDLHPHPHVGGGVTYAAVVAKRLGLSTHIITKCPPDSPYIQELENLGITIHRLPVREKKFENLYTSFDNRYDEMGNRTQLCPDKQEDITRADIPNFPDIPKGSHILLAPVIGEIDQELFSLLSQKGDVALIPQGNFRQRQPDSSIKNVPLEDPSFFSFSKTTILSNEDIAFGDKKNYLEELIETCPVVIETQGENGSIIFQKGQQSLHIPAFHLSANEIIDLTGAGDCYAAAFLVGIFQGKTLKEAGHFASLYAALKISGLGGKGVGLVTIPTKKQVDEYIRAHSTRMDAFYKN